MNLAIYVHWPFCVSKCPYCDFNSHVGDTQSQEKWRQAYRRELEHYAALLPNGNVTSIFFGGGTPSLMEARTVASVITDIARLWAVDDKVEITLEANPSSSEAAKFADFRAAGVNRLSLGVQSLDEQALKFLGRAHDGDEARRAITLAAKIFARFSFDLIYARQGQTPDMWQGELREALTLAGDHLSLYQLTIEPHTQFYVRAKRGEVLTAIDDHAVAMFEATQEVMDAVGLPAYEISNHARAGHESRHNLAYWHYQDYIGIGPGAHGRIRRQKTGIGDQGNPLLSHERYDSPPLAGGVRGGVYKVSSSIFFHAVENHRAPDIWLQEVATHGHGIKSDTTLDAVTSMREALMMGLRLTNGIDMQQWAQKFTMSLPQFLSAEKLARLQAEDYILLNKNNLRATRTGLQRLNAVLGYLEN